MKTVQGSLIAIIVCALTSVGLFGCNTFRGIGKDIQKGGETIEDAADKAQSKTQRVYKLPNAHTPTMLTGLECYWSAKRASIT